MKYSSHLAHLGGKKAFLRRKRREGVALCKAINAMRIGCAYLPPSADCDAGTLLRKLEDWIKGPCRAAWRKA